MVILRTNRTYYNAEEAARDSITVAELIECLENCSSSDKVIFSNDNGYTYGYISEKTVKEI